MIESIFYSRNAGENFNAYKCANYLHIKEYTLNEFKAFIGLLYLSELYRPERENLSFLWAVDGTGVEIFRLTMAQQRFHFIQSNLCFDDKSTNIERSILDNLALIRELFDSLVNNCTKIYIPNDIFTIDACSISRKREIQAVHSFQTCKIWFDNNSIGRRN